MLTDERIIYIGRQRRDTAWSLSFARAIEAEVRGGAQEPEKHEEYDPAIFEVLLKTFAIACAFGPLPERLNAASDLRKFFAAPRPTTPCPACEESFEDRAERYASNSMLNLIEALQAKIAEQADRIAELEQQCRTSHSMETDALARTIDEQAALIEQVRNALLWKNIRDGILKALNIIEDYKKERIVCKQPQYVK